MPAFPDDEGPPLPGEHNDAIEPLPRDIREHLGRQLRSAYNADAEKPAYLGDPAVPPHFERLIRRIEVSEKVREIGVEAVRQALQPAAAGKGEPDGNA
jgi:hypothetical protein